MLSDVGPAPASDTSVPHAGWWKDYVETVPDGYLDLIAAEEDAIRILHFHPTFVPGLLQTEQYAAAITSMTSLKTMTDADVAALVKVRMLRQRAAFAPGQRKDLVFILDERSLRRPVGSAATMRGQLERLRRAAGEPAVSLVVLPSDGQPHPGLLGPFMVLQYGSGLPDVLCLEWQLGNTIVRDRPDLIGRYAVLAEKMAGADPDGGSALTMIEAALARS